MNINLSLKYKLLILLLATSLLPIMIVSYSSQYFLFRSSTDYAGSVSNQYVQFLSREMTNYLEELDALLSPIYVNSEFQRFLNTPRDDIQQQAQLSASFRPFIHNILQTKSEIQGVLYLDNLGKSNYISYHKNFDFLYSFQTDPFYNSISDYTVTELAPLHRVTYTLGTPYSVFSFVKPVVNLSSGHITAWMIIEIHEDQIQDFIEQADLELDSRLFLFHSKSNSLVSNEPVSMPFINDLTNKISSNSENHASFLLESGQENYQITYHSVAFGDWKLVWLAPLNSINNGVEKAIVLTVLIAAVSLIISLIVAFPVMNKVLLPLFNLTKSIRKLGRGTFAPVEIKPPNDEFGILILSYNRMLNELQTMEKEVYQSQLKEKERELLQLQAQINPHFLFNTLETIESYSMKNNGQAVGDMVQSVAKMMRYSVRNDGGWSPVKDEISYIHHFLNIHYYRHGAKVSIHMDMDPACNDIRIMKLSIQPFIENSIKYGWNPLLTSDQFSLSVTINLIEKHLRIIIQDTGTGMPENTLNKLIEMIDNKGTSTDSFFHQHTGILNVCRRFFLAYGENTSIRIQSAPDSGTTVSLSIPL